MPSVADRGSIAFDAAVVLKLAAVSAQRGPEDGPRFGGAFRLPAPDAAGVFQVSLSGEAWIDVVQNGARLKSSAFTGKRGCDGLRKSVRFELTTAPALIRISGASATSLKLVVTRGE